MCSNTCCTKGINNPRVSCFLKPTGSVCASGNTTRTSGVGSVKILSLQISKTGDAAKRKTATAIRSTSGDGIAEIGIASLHGNKPALLGSTQNARVVGDGLNILALTGGGQNHFVI
jgi:hypothetical protein